MDDLIPKLVTRHSHNELKIVWSNDKECIYSLRLLRYQCQCALCKHEITKEKLIKLDDISNDIDLIKVEVVGNYALAFSFSDGHSTGIYSYEYLSQLCNN